MESIERLAESIPAPEKDVNQESAEMLKALYDVGEKITGVITKLSEMSDKMNTINQESDDTEDTDGKDDTEDTDAKDESEDN
jgi:hypothetical protein